jgi:hypothetical protein
MHEIYLTSMRDTLLIGVPFLAILALAIFRVDTFFFAPKGSSVTDNKHRKACGMNEKGEPILVDPDGRPSGFRQKSK